MRRRGSGNYQKGPSKEESNPQITQNDQKKESLSNLAWSDFREEWGSNNQNKGNLTTERVMVNHNHIMSKESVKIEPNSIFEKIKYRERRRKKESSESAVRERIDRRNELYKLIDSKLSEWRNFNLRNFPIEKDRMRLYDFLSSDYIPVVAANKFKNPEKLDFLHKKM